MIMKDGFYVLLDAKDNISLANPIAWIWHRGNKVYRIDGWEPENLYGRILIPVLIEMSNCILLCTNIIVNLNKYRLSTKDYELILDNRDAMKMFKSFEAALTFLRISE